MSSKKAYHSDYYERVTKPKRDALRASGLTTHGKPRVVERKPRIIKQLSAEDIARQKFTGRQQGINLQHRISYFEFNRRFKTQDNKCAICGIDDAKRWTIDHDPVTQRVRGILCHRCNVGLGFYAEDPSLLLSAARYIRKHRKQAT